MRNSFVPVTGLVTVSADLKTCFGLYVVKARSNSTALLDRLREARITRSGEACSSTANGLWT
jgi:hypothetical protein